MRVRLAARAAKLRLWKPVQARCGFSFLGETQHVLGFTATVRLFYRKRAGFHRFTLTLGGPMAVIGCVFLFSALFWVVGSSDNRQGFTDRVSH